MRHIFLRIKYTQKTNSKRDIRSAIIFPLDSREHQIAARRASGKEEYVRGGDCDGWEFYCWSLLIGVINPTQIRCLWLMVGWNKMDGFFLGAWCDWLCIRCSIVVNISEMMFWHIIRIKSIAFQSITVVIMWNNVHDLQVHFGFSIITLSTSLSVLYQSFIGEHQEFPYCRSLWMLSKLMRVHTKSKRAH